MMSPPITLSSRDVFVRRPRNFAGATDFGNWRHSLPLMSWSHFPAADVKRAVTDAQDHGARLSIYRERGPSLYLTASFGPAPSGDDGSIDIKSRGLITHLSSRNSDGTATLASSKIPRAGWSLSSSSASRWRMSCYVGFSDGRDNFPRRHGQPGILVMPAARAEVKIGVLTGVCRHYSSLRLPSSDCRRRRLRREVVGLKPRGWLSAVE